MRVKGGVDMAIMAISVAVCCRMLQYVAAWCSVLQSLAVWRSVMRVKGCVDMGIHFFSKESNDLKIWYVDLRSVHTATHCNTLQHTATHCNTLQHTATHCNTLQHTETH